MIANITGEKEVSNLDMAKQIAKYMGKPLVYEMEDNIAERPGHDLRYALDSTKIFEMGFKLPVDFELSLKRTIEWTLTNKKWLEY